MKAPRIKELVVTPIAITDPPLLNSVGIHAPYALRTVIELITEDNISGISEIPGNQEIDQLLNQSRPLIVGASPFQLNKLRTDLFEQFANHELDQRGEKPWDERKLIHVYSALEVACLDIQGKISNLPVVDLLGGKCRDRVSFAAYLFYKPEGAGGRFGFGRDTQAVGWDKVRQDSAQTPTEIVNQAKVMCKTYGFKSIKLKGGVYAPDKEVDTMFKLKEAFGKEVPLRFDPNGVWSVNTSIRFGRQMENILEYLEDPTRGQQGMAAVRKALDLPLATNMCTTSFDDIPSSIALGSEDIILSDHHFWGGLRDSVILGKICQTFGKGLSMHSNSHLGISLMAMVHMAGAIPNLTFDLDTHYPWQSEEVISGGQVSFEEGSIQVPSEPGLGISLDRKSLAILHENYKNCGLTGRDDTAEMQKLQPDWRYKPIRW